MPFQLFDYMRPDGVNDFLEWAQGLSKRQRARLDQKADMLERVGMGLLPETLTGSEEAGVLKMRLLVDKVQLRPLLCRGPADPNAEFTFLCGAFEVGDKIVPRGQEALAGKRRQEIINNPSRRVSHEQVA